jgi:hypothetical protein
MPTLSLDDLRALARGHGLEIPEDELRGLLPLVQGTRQMMAALGSALGPEVEPASQYRIL